jgi:guanosine-3',5'-bis(diphosphate) 3'-pyrophosphohydrolase
MIYLPEAIALAAKAHENQLDKNYQPYILHPIRVMQGVSHYNCEITSMTAILHDVIEDTSWSLSKGCPYSICKGQVIVQLDEDLFKALTAITKNPGEDYQNYMDRVLVNIHASRVKLADLNDNMDPKRMIGTSQKDLERMSKYMKSYELVTKALKTL